MELDKEKNDELIGFDEDEREAHNEQEPVYFSPSTGGFYLRSFHGDAIPDNAVAITPELHTALLEGQGAGKIITPPNAEHDLPYLADPPPLTTEQLAAVARAKRDSLLAAADYLMMPDYPISENARTAVQAYRQALRDITKQAGFPSEVIWPEKPEV